jgi:hypothetical protein
MLTLALPGACLVVIALLAVYVPTIYIRKTNKILGVLQQIAANTQGINGEASDRRQVRTA